MCTKEDEACQGGYNIKGEGPEKGPLLTLR